MLLRVEGGGLRGARVRVHTFQCGSPAIDFYRFILSIVSSKCHKIVPDLTAKCIKISAGAAPQTPLGSSKGFPKVCLVPPHRKKTGNG